MDRMTPAEITLLTVRQEKKARPEQRKNKDLS
jgi:hypothetical protein